MSILVMKHARCTHGLTQHEVIEGKTWCNGQWTNRSLVAGTWTKQFGKHILACAGVALLQVGCWQQRHAGALAFVSNFDGGVEPQMFLKLECQEAVCSKETCCEWASIHGVMSARAAGAPAVRPNMNVIHDLRSRWLMHT